MMEKETVKHLDFDIFISLDSFEEWERYAEQGYVEAQTTLGDFYMTGTKGVEQDYAKALKWYKKAAEQGSDSAKFRIGEFYQFGYGVKKNCKKAFACYEKQAKQGFCLAQYRLALLYYNGVGVEQDCTKAVYWFKQAAEQNICEAQYYLGMCYLDGCGIGRDFEKAYSLFRKAALRKYGMAQYSLGDCYRLGIGVGIDYERAGFWYCKAIENGIEDAKKEKEVCELNMGLMDASEFAKERLMSQVGVGEKIEEEKGKLEKYIEERNAEGILYYASLVAGTDEDLAIDCCRKAAEFGNARAQYALGVLYYNGNNLEQNYKMAFKWFEKAAEQGYVDAQFMLGQIYWNGKGVEKNTAKAEVWFSKAAENGGYSFYRNYPGITWQEKLRQRIRFSGEEALQIRKKSHISKQTFEKIINEKTNVIKKETVLALAIGFRYDINEAVQFLSEMGYAFSEIEGVDKIVMGFILEKNYNIDDINAELYKNNLPLLGDERNA